MLIMLFFTVVNHTEPLRKGNIETNKQTNSMPCKVLAINFYTLILTGKGKDIFLQACWKTYSLGIHSFIKGFLLSARLQDFAIGTLSIR